VASAGPERVIVIGAGPTGLALAAELALAGVECLVLERRAALRTDSRAICLHARSMEMLDLRGWRRPLPRPVCRYLHSRSD
jgi:2-polyprenyl-6-methoxyphenol hydroxylase-like FAD-dependent oxidoreductase